MCLLAVRTPGGVLEELGVLEPQTDRTKGKNSRQNPRDQGQVAIQPETQKRYEDDEGTLSNCAVEEAKVPSQHVIQPHDGLALHSLKDEQ